MLPFLLGTQIALVASVVIFTVVIADPCLLQNGLWGDDNPQVYYFCNTTTNQAVSSHCPQGRGFIKNSTIEGCVPYHEWNCFTAGNDLKRCTPSIVTPWSGSNPATFYLCANGNRVSVDCLSGLGFVENEEALGCVPWSQWRALSKCAQDLRKHDMNPPKPNHEVDQFVSTFRLIEKLFYGLIESLRKQLRN